MQRVYRDFLCNYARNSSSRGKSARRIRSRNFAQTPKRIYMYTRGTRRTRGLKLASLAEFVRAKITTRTIHSERRDGNSSARGFTIRRFRARCIAILLIAFNYSRFTKSPANSPNAVERIGERCINSGLFVSITCTSMHK